MNHSCTDPAMLELLPGYELDQLNETDRERFEEHLLECDFCANEVREMWPLASMMTEHRDELLAALRQDGLTYRRLRRSLRRRNWIERLTHSFGGFKGRMILAGATAVVLCLLLWPRTGDSPYREYLSYNLPPYNAGIELRGKSRNEASAVFESAMEAYRNGDYTEAIKGIRAALDRNPDYPERWLYLGVSQYAIHDAHAAVRSLKKADAASDGLIKIRARWYLAQSYLYLGNADRAQPLLEWIVAQDREHAADAQTLLARISTRE